MLPLIIAGLFISIFYSAKLLEIFLRKVHGLLEATVPLMAVNCTLLGIVLISANAAAGAAGATLYALSLACGAGAGPGGTDIFLLEPDAGAVPGMRVK